MANPSTDGDDSQEVSQRDDERDTSPSTSQQLTRRNTLRTLGGVSAGAVGIGALSGVASADYIRPDDGGSDHPVTYTEKSEDTFEQVYTNANDTREGVFRKVTQLTERKHQDLAGSEVMTTIEVANLTESVYTDETVEEHDLDHYACFQQDQNQIEVTYPEKYGDDEVRFEFETDADHIAGFRPSGETNGDTADVAEVAVDTGLAVLTGLGRRAGRVFKVVGGVTTAYDLATSLYEWYDDQDSDGYTWNWEKPGYSPDEYPENAWSPGRACTASWMRFDVEWDRDVTPEFTVRDTTVGHAHGRTHEINWSL